MRWTPGGRQTANECGKGEAERGEEGQTGFFCLILKPVALVNGRSIKCDGAVVARPRVADWGLQSEVREGNVRGREYANEIFNHKVVKEITVEGAAHDAQCDIALLSKRGAEQVSRRD